MAIDGGARWRYTEFAENMAKRDGNPKSFEEKWFQFGKGKEWQGRKLIGRDKRINKGVYLCADKYGVSSEACVVDDTKQPELNTCYEELRRRAENESLIKGKPINQFVLDMAMDLVEEVMPYDKEKADSITAEYDSGTKVALSSYVLEHAGVCRHQALLAGYLIEKLIDDGVLHGRVSVDRNYIPGEGGHAWVRYKNSKGKVFILDTAQNFRGALEDSKKKASWDYGRPSDKKWTEKIPLPKFLTKK